MSGLSLLIESAVKVSLLVGGALAAVSLLPRASAALRHWILAAAIGCALLTPILQPMVPAWSMMPRQQPSRRIKHRVRRNRLRQPATQRPLPRQP
jgi:hypothetical protein